MSTSMNIKVVGVKDAINGLKKIDPELQKEFKLQANEVAKPAIDAGKAAYQPLSNESHPYALSGMSRNWTDKKTGRKIFPFKLDRAIKGVQLKFDTRKKAIGVIMILQKDVATAVWETAGRKQGNPLGRSLGFVAQDQTRILKPAVEKSMPQVEREMANVVKEALRTVQRGI